MAEINDSVAERVMGWTKRLLAGRLYWFGPYDGRLHPRIDYAGIAIGDDAVMAFAEPSDAEYWSPSTDIRAALPVAEKMGGGLMLMLVEVPEPRWIAYSLKDDNYCATDGQRYVTLDFTTDEAFSAETAPLAICRAALATHQLAQ